MHVVHSKGGDHILALCKLLVGEWGMCEQNIFIVVALLYIIS